MGTPDPIALDGLDGIAEIVAVGTHPRHVLLQIADQDGTLVGVYVLETLAKCPDLASAADFLEGVHP